MEGTRFWFGYDGLVFMSFGRTTPRESQRRMALYPERIVRRLQFDEHLVNRQQRVPGQVRVAHLGLPAKPRRLGRHEGRNDDPVAVPGWCLIEKPLQAALKFSLTNSSLYVIYRYAI